MDAQGLSGTQHVYKVLFKSYTIIVYIIHDICVCTCVFMPQDMWWAEGSFPEATSSSTMVSRDELELRASGLVGRQGLLPAELASPCNKQEILAATTVTAYKIQSIFLETISHALKQNIYRNVNS